MASIARQSGVYIRVSDAAHPVKLTDSFVELPLADGLRRLLRGGSHVFIYSDSGPNARLGKVIVMSIRSVESQGNGEAPLAPAQGLKDDLDMAWIVDEFKALTGSRMMGPGSRGSTAVPEAIGVPTELIYSRDAIREQLQQLREELDARSGERI